HFGKGQAIRYYQRFMDQRRVSKGDGLVAQHTLEQILDGDVADDVIDVAIADRIRRMRLTGNARADHFVRVVVQKEHHAVAVGHGAGQGTGFQLEDILDDLLLTGGQGAGLSTGL